MRILFIGDIISKIGRQTVKEVLSSLQAEFHINLTIANVENTAGFRGLDDKSYRELKSAGVDIMTSGNHIWANKAAFSILKNEDNITVPGNFPILKDNDDPPGKGFVVTEVLGKKVAIMNLQGRVFMENIDCPFKAAEAMLSKMNGQIKHKILDFHAEATSEKRAMGHFLDGRVSAVLGTHTHVQTADEEILPKGSAYITDVGMTGPRDSVIGIKKEIIIEKFITGLPQRFEVSKSDPFISFVVLELDDNTGKALSIKRFTRSVDV